MQESVKKTITNSKVRDSGGKIIFGDNTLCSQFLRDYIHLPYLKDVQPEDLVGKVKEKKMARLFENMDKMDIQLERRKTEEQRRKTEEQCRKTEEQRKRAEEAEKKLESSIRLLVESCQEFGASKEALVNKLADKYEMELDIAEAKVEKYWKENC